MKLVKILSFSCSTGHFNLSFDYLGSLGLKHVTCHWPFIHIPIGTCNMSKWHTKWILISSVLSANTTVPRLWFKARILLAHECRQLSSSQVDAHMSKTRGLYKKAISDWRGETGCFETWGHTTCVRWAIIFVSFVTPHFTDDYFNKISQY